MAAPTWCHVACEAPLCRWMWQFWLSNSHIFNLVFHLSNVKQLAFRFCTFFHVLLLLWSLANLWTCTLCVKPHGTVRNSFLSLQLKLFHSATWQHRHHACLFLQVWFLWFSGEVKHFVHLIHLNLHSCLCPRGLIRLLSLCGSNLSGFVHYLGTESSREFDLTRFF